MEVKMTPMSNLRCCYNCIYWHKRKNYDCQHNGPYGGDGMECIFKRKQSLKEIYGNKRSVEIKS